MDNIKYVLDNWCCGINQYEKLNFNDARELYIKMINSDECSKEILRERIITGTLYLIPKFINRSLFPFIKGGSYDIDDVINACNEVWINVIDNGGLLNVSFFSELFDDSFYNNVINQFVYRYDLYSDFNINNELFVHMLHWYINNALGGVEIDYDYFLEHLNSYTKVLFDKHLMVSPCKDPLSIYEMIVSIYEQLVKNGYCEEKISERKLLLLKNMLIDNVMYCSSKDVFNEKEDDYSVFYLNNVLKEEIMDVILSNSNLSKKQMDMLLYRYGIIDGEYKTFEATGKKFGVSKERIFDSEKRVIHKIRTKNRRAVGLMNDYFYLEPKKNI